ncbi:MAG: cytochrome c [Cytophagaceae bacterium]|nr:cytochrome c [Gemmatimonadaceae bacterium]
MQLSRYMGGALLAFGFLGLTGVGGWLWLGLRANELAAAPVQVPADSVAVSGDSLSLVEGERVAWLRGCHGCHGDSLQGKVFLDEPRVIRLVAPNVTTAITSYSDAELARLIRHGVTRTGRAAFAMPSAMFYHLSDADLGRMLAHLRSAPTQSLTHPATELRLMAKIGLVTNKVPRDANTMDHQAPRLGNRADTTQLARGEYLAMTSCTECHGVDLRGDATTPALAKALGYTLPQFTSLLLDGRARDGRDLGLMGTTARSRFVHFRRDEVDAIWAWLQAMPLGAATK